MSILKSLHWVARAVFRQSGYRWEVRRNGELKLGLWRKSLGKRESRSGKKASKRFVIVPGFGDTSLSWLTQATLLSPVLRRAGFDEVVILDFPGFNGFLSHEKSFHSMDLLMAAVGDVFDSLAPHTILGHSLGGWLVGRYAIECGRERRPAVRKRHGYLGPETILLACPGGVFAREELRVEFEDLFRKVVAGQGSEDMRSRLFAKEPFWFKYVARDFTDFALDESIRQFTESVRDEHFVHPELHHVRATPWLIWGDQDRLCPTECVDAWLDGLQSADGSRRARAVLLRGVGHSPHVEAPGVTAAVIGQVLLDKIPHPRGGRWWKIVEKEKEPQEAPA